MNITSNFVFDHLYRRTIYIYIYKEFINNKINNK